MPYLDIFGLEFQKTIVIFEVSTLEFVKFQNFVKKWKCLNFGMKMPKFGTKYTLFGYFCARILKNICHIWYQHPQTSVTAKLLEKMKRPTFGTKNTLFRHFITGILKYYCHIWNQHPRICLIAKFWGKTKMPKFWIKNAFLGIFGLEFQKTIVIFEISTLEFVRFQNFVKKWKCLNLGKKMPKFGTKYALFGYFWIRILKNYCHIWNHHPQVCHKWVFNSYSEFWDRVHFF